MGVALLVLGVVMAAYGVAMAALYPAGGFFVLWLLIAAGLIVAGQAFRTGAWRQASAWVRHVACAAALAVLLFVGAGCATMLSVRAAPVPTGLDYLVVLGAGLDSDGSPSETLRYRLDAALAYLDAPGNEGTCCVVTGGQGGDEPRTEASSMAAYLRERGISEDRIVLEERATSTVENLAYSRELLPADARVGVVTSDFHLFRALRIAERQGFADAAGIPARVNPLYQPHNVLRECLVLAKDAILGNV